MGFSSHGIILGIIKQLYLIDFQINRLYSRKFRIQKFAQTLGIHQTRAQGLGPNQVMQFQVLDFNGEEVELSRRRYANGPPPGAGAPPSPVVDPLTGESLGLRQYTYLPGNSVPGIAAAGVRPNIAGGTVQLEDGWIQTVGAEAKPFLESQSKGLNGKETEIDQQLEILKSQRTALNAQRDEFQKYIAEGIKNTFKNNYA